MFYCMFCNVKCSNVAELIQSKFLVKCYFESKTMMISVFCRRTYGWTDGRTDEQYA